MVRLICLFYTGLVLSFAQTPELPPLKSGDLIFQTSRSAQSQALQIVTQSKLSHMGVIFLRDDSLYVLEAVQPVKWTPLQSWIARGVEGRFTIKRLKNADSLLTAGKINQLLSAGQAYLGKNYDPYFEWSDDRIYCSELVWKIYNSAFNLQIGTQQKMAEFDFSHPLVKAKMMERFGDNIPIDEWVITPEAMFQSGLLTQIWSNY